MEIQRGQIWKKTNNDYSGLPNRVIILEPDVAQKLDIFNNAIISMFNYEYGHLIDLRNPIGMSRETLLGLYELEQEE